MVWSPFIHIMLYTVGMASPIKLATRNIPLTKQKKNKKKTGTVMTIHRLSEVHLGWMFGTVYGRKGWVFAGNVEILD